MHRKRIGISFLLILSLLLQFIFIPVNASEASTPQPTYLRIFNGNTEETYTVLYLDNEVYFPAESYEKLTNYTLTSGNGTYGYQLGSKTIVINVQKREMQIPTQQYTGKFGNIITLDGIDYLPASELLPWMNVACNVHNGVLEIVPDGVSIWEIIDELTYSEYMFNIYEEYGDSISSIAGLSAMIVFDTFINIRFNRLISADGTITGLAKGNSLYDYECYKSALVEIAQTDSFSGENAQNVIDSVVNVNKGLDALEKIYEYDEYESLLDFGGFLTELGVDAEVLSNFYLFSDIWETFRILGSGYSEVQKHFDVISVLKTYEIIVKTDNEYRNYIKWLSEKQTGNTLFDNALDDTVLLLDENIGLIYSSLMNLASKFVQNTAEDFMLGSLSLHIDVAKLVYSTIIPVSRGFEGAAKSGVVETIQDYCWSLANSLQQKEMTAENIAHIRQSYLCALKASKINYEVLQDLFNVKAITLFDGEGLLSDKIAAIDEKILQLIASGDATENDSIEGKDDYQRNLRTIFAELETTKQATADVTLDELLPLLELLNSFYAETYGAEVNWSETYYRVYENEDSFDNGDDPIAIKLSVPGEQRNEVTFDPVELSLYVVQNFSSLAEWQAYLLQYMNPELVEEWIDYGAYEFVTYNDILYLVRGGRGYGSYSLKLLTARLIYNESNKCSITVDRYSFDNYDCTLRVDFVWSQGKWMIEDYKQTDSNRNEIDMFVSMSHGDIVREFIKPINEIYGLFNGAWIDAVDLNQVVYRDGVQWGYVKVTDPRFAKYSDFKAYVAQYLSENIVDELFASDWFIQVGDDTYKLNDYGGLGSDITIWSIEYAPYARTENSVIFSACVQRIKPEAMSNTVITDNDLTEEWIYYTLEKIDEKWVFTDYTPIG